jgi:hypothetical protein
MKKYRATLATKTFRDGETGLLYLRVGAREWYRRNKVTNG